LAVRPRIHFVCNSSFLERRLFDRTEPLATANLGSGLALGMALQLDQSAANIMIGFVVPAPVSQRARPAPLWPWILVCAVAALCIDLGCFHRQQNADSIIPVLSSLNRWTPFFWGQDRFGQLLPLLAIPFEHPLVNLLVQTGLAIFAGLLALSLLPRYLQRDAHWPKTGAVLVVLFLALSPQTFQFFLLSGCQPYGTSLALSLGGMILLEDHSARRNPRSRLFAAWALIMIAHWVNPTSAWVLIPLVLGRYLIDRQIERSECVCTVTVLAGSALASLGASYLIRTWQLYPQDIPTWLQLADPRSWPITWWRLIWDQCAMAGPFVPVLLAATLAAPLAGRYLPAGHRTSLSWRSGILSALAAYCACLAITGSLTWVQINAQNYRYMMPAFAMLSAGLACACWKPFWEILTNLLNRKGPVRPLILSSFPIAVISAAVVTYGPPSLATVRHEVDVSCGQYSDDIRSAKCTLVVGSYWKVWPAVFHANLVAFEQGESQFVWGEAQRATVARDLWNRLPAEEIRLAFLSDGTEEDVRAGSFDTRVFDLDGMRRRPHGAIEVLSPAEVFLVWARGFRRLGLGETDRTIQAQADLWICNTTDVSQNITLELDLTCTRGKFFPLSISSDMYRDRLETDDDSAKRKCRLAIPPGRNVVEFRCDAPEVQSRLRSGRTYGHIAGPRIAPVLNTAGLDGLSTTRN
jgi:hypothetical protein